MACFDKTAKLHQNGFIRRYAKKVVQAMKIDYNNNMQQRFIFKTSELLIFFQSVWV